MGCLSSKPSPSESDSSLTNSLLGADCYNSNNLDPALTETEAIILAANYCKDSPFRWCDEALPNIGSRALKWHYLVQGVEVEAGGKKRNKKPPPLVPMVMALTYLRPDHFPIPLTSPAALEVFCSLCTSSSSGDENGGGGMANPYLFPLQAATYMRERRVLVAIRQFTEVGSLRDLIYSKQRPKSPFAQKYARSNGRPLPLAQVQTYGRHILEGLKALNAKGIVVDCLTSGNVLVHKKVARISDLENTLLGGGASGRHGGELVEVLMESAALALEQGKTACAFDVQLFGMFHRPLSTNISSRCPIVHRLIFCFFAI